LRVITGSAKGRNLLVPNIPGLRPVKSIVKHAIFSILGDKILDSNILDLFAGSGSLGIEALSRGAKYGVFIDHNRECTEIITKNLQLTKLSGQSEVQRSDVSSYLGKTEKSFDIVFLDAPYHLKRIKKIFHSLPLVLDDESQIVYLHARNDDEIIELKDFVISDTRNFGKTTVTFLKHKPNIDPSKFQ